MHCASLVDGLERSTLASCTAATAIGAALRVSFEVRSLGRIEIADVTTNAVTLAADGGAAAGAMVTVWIQVSGAAIIAQGGRRVSLTAGDLCILRATRPARATLGEGRLMLVNLPEAEVAQRFPYWRTAMVRPVPVGGGVPAVFLDAVQSLTRWRESIDQLASETVADAIIDLAGALVCFAAPDDSGCIKRSLQQRDRVKRVAEQHLRNPELNVEWIAAKVALSTRQVHRLFVGETMSLMRWIWAQRLENCYRELIQDRAGKRSLSDVAYAWGFNDQAHFSRAFRRQFGLSPREARRHTPGDH
ncbi:MAG: helix-turn-helix domain-containing protein [Thiohalocapsa sp.]